jgi:hypothetical protein
VRKKRKADFNIVLMVMFSRTILFVSMWTRDKVENTNAVKEGSELLVFTTPVSLNG